MLHFSAITIIINLDKFSYKSDNDPEKSVTLITHYNIILLQSQ